MTETVTGGIGMGEMQPNSEAHKLREQVKKLGIVIDRERRKLGDLESDAALAKSGKGEYEIEAERSRYRLSQWESELAGLQAKLREAERAEANSISE